MSMAFTTQHFGHDMCAYIWTDFRSQLCCTLNSITVTYHVMLAGVLWEITPTKLGIRQQNLLDCLQPSPFTALITPFLLSWHYFLIKYLEASILTHLRPYNRKSQNSPSSRKWHSQGSQNFMTKKYLLMSQKDPDKKFPFSTLARLGSIQSEMCYISI